MTLSLDELAVRVDEPVERLREWQAAGLLPDGDRLEAADGERARLISFLLRRGFELETIARAERQRAGLLQDFLDQMHPSGSFPEYSIAEAAEKAGLDLDLAHHLSEVAGLREHGYAAGREDVQALRSLSATLDAGFPETALLEIVRVYADALRRVAEAEVRLFHFHVHERLRAADLSNEELHRATDAAADQLSGLVEPTILYFHRKGWIHALRDDLALHVVQEAGLSEVSEVPGTLSVAILFADLARFTPLTEVMGDAAAADVVDRFSKLVRTAVSGSQGRIVKQIGDEFMVVFFEPRCAVECALDIEQRAAQEPQFPAVRSAAHWGPVLYREGDYVGSTVNLAARLAAEAGPHQLLVTSELRRAAEGLTDVAFVPIGRRSFKGVTDAIEVFEVRQTSAMPTQKQVDPVCGMELNPTDVAATLDVRGETKAFCSTDCLQRFVADPDRYAS